MKKRIIEQIKCTIVIIICIVPYGLINTALEVWEYEH